MVFLILAGIATGQQEFSASGAAILFVEEAVGGAVLGLVLGWDHIRDDTLGGPIPD